MVDVGSKPRTERIAEAEAKIFMRPETLKAIRAGNMKKGDVFATARIAAIMAAKRTHELIPLCHPVPVTAVEVEILPCGPDCVAVRSTVRCTYETGVEMEALCAVTVGALTVYDMCKAIDRGMMIGEARLLYKEGGKSGVFSRGVPGEVLCANLSNEMNGAISLLWRRNGQGADGAFEPMQNEGSAVAGLHLRVAEIPQAGDRIRIGAALIEIVETGAERQCGARGWARARVLEPGAVRAGMQIEVSHA